jgi:hypothetical protein
VTGNIALWNEPIVALAGKQYLLFDVGGALGIAGMTVALLCSTVKHTLFPYHAERIS